MISLGDIMIDKASYNIYIKRNQVKPKFFSNALKAFLVGGLISVFGQSLIFLYEGLFNMEKDIAISLMISTLILIGTILTAFGIYDKIGQFAGAGALVPITGFANTMTSCALEYKSEGIITGVASNMFKLAGSVIVIGVVSAYTFGMVRYVIELL